MPHPDPHDDAPIFCARCSAELKPGGGDFFVVKIEAMADPAPPVISGEDLMRDSRAEMGRLIEQMEGLSERELVDQVHRRLVLHLCTPCYRLWIENPAR